MKEKDSNKTSSKKIRDNKNDIKKTKNLKVNQFIHSSKQEENINKDFPSLINLESPEDEKKDRVSALNKNLSKSVEIKLLEEMLTRFEKLPIDFP